MVNPKSLKNLKSRKGCPNLFTKVKAEMVSCFNRGEFEKWAKTHQSEYYKITASLLPKEVGITGAEGKPLSIKVEVVETK